MDIEHDPPHGLRATSRTNQDRHQRRQPQSPSRNHLASPTHNTLIPTHVRANSHPRQLPDQVRADATGLVTPRREPPTACPTAPSHDQSKPTPHYPSGDKTSRSPGRRQQREDGVCWWHPSSAAALHRCATSQGRLTLTLHPRNSGTRDGWRSKRSVRRVLETLSFKASLSACGRRIYADDRQGPRSGAADAPRADVVVSDRQNHPTDTRTQKDEQRPQQHHLLRAASEHKNAQDTRHPGESEPWQRAGLQLPQRHHAPVTRRHQPRR